MTHPPRNTRIRRKLYLFGLAMFTIYMITVVVYHNWLTVATLFGCALAVWLYHTHLRGKP